MTCRGTTQPSQKLCFNKLTADAPTWTLVPSLKSTGLARTNEADLCLPSIWLSVIRHSPLWLCQSEKSTQCSLWFLVINLVFSLCLHVGPAEQTAFHSFSPAAGSASLLTLEDGNIFYCGLHDHCSLLIIYCWFYTIFVQFLQLRWSVQLWVRWLTDDYRSDLLLLLLKLSPLGCWNTRLHSSDEEKVFLADSATLLCELRMTRGKNANCFPTNPLLPNKAKQCRWFFCLFVISSENVNSALIIEMVFGTGKTHSGSKWWRVVNQHDILHRWAELSKQLLHPLGHVLWWLVQNVSRHLIKEHSEPDKSLVACLICRKNKW